MHVSEETAIVSLLALSSLILPAWAELDACLTTNEPVAFSFLVHQNIPGAASPESQSARKDRSAFNKALASISAQREEFKTLTLAAELQAEEFQPSMASEMSLFGLQGRP